MSDPDPADPNLGILVSVAQSLGDLRDTLVFVGGCATGLLVTNVRAQAIRPTKDVDLVAHVTSAQAYHALESRFRELGFANDTSPDAPICRWKRGEVLVDLMPTAEGILGFHNPWYRLAVETAQAYPLPDGTEIRLIAAPVFLATKLEAFKGRGKGDFRASHDLEDIVTVINGRDSLMEEFHACAPGLRTYLQDEFTKLLKATDFLDALPGHLSPDRASQQRIRILMERLGALAGQGG